jgi:hypothetical protein
MILWFLNIRHSGTLFGMWFPTSAQQMFLSSYPLKIVKRTFSMILERVFEMVWWRGRKWNHIKEDFLKLKCFSPLKILTSPLFEETVGAFLFLPLLPFSIFLYLFYALSLEDSEVLMIFEEKITSSKTSFQMTWHGMAWSWLWIYRRWRHIPEWSYACQYSWTMMMEMWELWIYQWWTHIPEWRYAHQYFWVSLANNLGSKSFLKNFQNSIGHIP